MARLGDADLIARALSIVAWILARLRMIEGSCTSRSTSRSVIAATRATSKPWKAIPNASASEHDRPAEPGLEHAQGERLEQRRLVVGARTPDLVVVAAKRCLTGSGPATTHLAVVTDDHVVAHPALRLDDPEESHVEAEILSNAGLALLSQPTAFFHATRQKRGCWTGQSSSHPAGVRAAGIG